MAHLTSATTEGLKGSEMNRFIKEKTSAVNENHVCYLLSFMSPVDNSNNSIRAPMILLCTDGITSVRGKGS